MCVNFNICIMNQKKINYHLLYEQFNLGQNLSNINKNRQMNSDQQSYLFEQTKP
ncbi:hypothetical protein pb186bvf_021019 [Paramecium bursaria]